MNRPKRADIPASWKRFLPRFHKGKLSKKPKRTSLDALKLVLECQRELAEKELSPQALRETIEFAGA